MAFPKINNPFAAIPGAVSKARAAPSPKVPTGEQNADPAFDLSKPTGAETFYGDNQPRIMANPQTAQHWNQVRGHYNVGQTPKGTTHAETEYQNLGNFGGNFDDYYDQAVAQSMRDISDSSAASGQLKSTHTMGQRAQSAQQMRAQQARDKAYYDLDAARTRSSVAGAADQSTGSAARDELAWTQGLGNLAQGADAAEQNRLNSAFNMLMGAGNQRLGRIGQAFDSTYGPEAMLAQMAFHGGIGAVENDQNLFGDRWNTELGGTREGLAGDTRRTNQLNQDIGNAIDAAGAYYGRPPTGGGGGGRNPLDPFR